MGIIQAFNIYNKKETPKTLFSRFFQIMWLVPHVLPLIVDAKGTFYYGSRKNYLVAYEMFNEQYYSQLYLIYPFHYLRF